MTNQRTETADGTAMAEVASPPTRNGQAVDLPVSTLREAVPYLRQPFTPEAIRFKVQSVFKDNSGCQIVAYIDARLVVERLNMVIPEWTEEYRRVEGSENLVWCHLTVGGITHRDIGEAPRKGMSKDLVSDGLKRAAVRFGVGVSIYALPEIRIMMRDARNRIAIRRDKIVLTEHGHDTLRVGYRRWLDEYGITMFGQPLDHGDREGWLHDPDDDALITRTFKTDNVPRVLIDGAAPQTPIDLEPAVREVVERAQRIGNHNLGDAETVSMIIGGRDDQYVHDWVEQATKNLDAWQEQQARAKDAENPERSEWLQTLAKAQSDLALASSDEEVEAAEARLAEAEAMGEALPGMEGT